jgi:hypothetical protein
LQICCTQTMINNYRYSYRQMQFFHSPASFHACRSLPSASRRVPSRIPVQVRSQRATPRECPTVRDEGRDSEAGARRGPEAAYGGLRKLCCGSPALLARLQQKKKKREGRRSSTMHARTRSSFRRTLRSVAACCVRVGAVCRCWSLQRSRVHSLCRWSVAAAAHCPHRVEMDALLLQQRCVALAELLPTSSTPAAAHTPTNNRADASAAQGGDAQQLPTTPTRILKVSGSAERVRVEVE